MSGYCDFQELKRKISDWLVFWTRREVLARENNRVNKEMSRKEKHENKKVKVLFTNEREWPTAQVRHFGSVEN